MLCLSVPAISDNTQHCQPNVSKYVFGEVARIRKNSMHEKKTRSNHFDNTSVRGINGIQYVRHNPWYKI